jgi:hypothetical protein
MAPLILAVVPFAFTPDRVSRSWQRGELAPAAEHLHNAAMHVYLRVVIYVAMFAAGVWSIPTWIANEHASKGIFLIPTTIMLIWVFEVVAPNNPKRPKDPD